MNINIYKICSALIIAMNHVKDIRLIYIFTLFTYLLRIGYKLSE